MTYIAKNILGVINEMPSINYPLDTTGLAASNLIQDELHTLTEVNASTYRILIPEFAPFYLDNFILKHVDSTGNITILTEGVDYTMCLPYIGGTRSIGKMLYGAITINNSIVNGIIKITYQTLGGEWTAEPNYILEALAEQIYNPRTTVWDVVTNKQDLFPPINHDQSLDYVYGYQDLLNSINDLADSIANTPSSTTNFIRHLIDHNNPHEVNKTQVGLGDVVNLPLATDQEVINKQPVNKYVTFKQLVDAGYFDASSQTVLQHLINNLNPHQVNKQQVGLGNVANLPLATDQEVADLQLLDKYVTLRQIIQLVQAISSEAGLSRAEMYYLSRS